MIRHRYSIKGVVQGVGFRPFVYRLAREYQLGGWILNSTRGVTLEIEGEEASVEAFAREVVERPPRLARITSIEREEIPPLGETEFRILKSRDETGKEVLISPDVATCPECRREVLDPRDRRLQYPFTNCTNCGPRFTIIRDTPYDRERTSMSSFPMCPRCEREYHDPLDRRFHAQPNACPTCGPQVKLVDREGRPVPGEGMTETRRLLREGRIVAVKGLGGFHLACDAGNEAAVLELRRRKARPAKPFAVMARDLGVVRRHCRVSPEEAVLLEAPEAPIVVLECWKPPDALLSALAPGLASLGVMLPYTPLHLLLFDESLELLVMTSGNISELPLIKDNEAALGTLGSIADFFLIHDREIHSRCDDSLVRAVGGEAQFLRRSRGWVPRPVRVSEGTGYGAEASDDAVLGVGGEMKNTFCLLKGTRAFLSQHLGEMEHEEGLENFRTALATLEHLTDIHPAVIVHDPHPGYNVSRLARELPAERRIEVQHHHAHLASCLADNCRDGEVIGIIADGTGYGTDGALWGFEILSGDYRAFRRHYHLEYCPLAGGEGAIRHPVRVAAVYTWKYLGEAGLRDLRRRFPTRSAEIDVAVRMAAAGINAVPASSCGRLFDAVSAYLGVCLDSTYEGQAAVELGELLSPRPALEGKPQAYRFDFRGESIWPGGIFEGMAGDVRAGVDRRAIAARFHETVVEMMAQGAVRVREERHLDVVALSGGTFQNPYLLVRVRDELRRSGFTVLTHRQVPANDGGLALGQAVVAQRLLGS